MPISPRDPPPLPRCPSPSGRTEDGAPSTCGGTLVTAIVARGEWSVVCWRCHTTHAKGATGREAELKFREEQLKKESAS